MSSKFVVSIYKKLLKIDITNFLCIKWKILGSEDWLAWPTLWFFNFREPTSRLKVKTGGWFWCHSTQLDEFYDPLTDWSFLTYLTKKLMEREGRHFELLAEHVLIFCSTEVIYLNYCLPSTFYILKQSTQLNN